MQKKVKAKRHRAEPGINPTAHCSKQTLINKGWKNFLST